MWNDIGQRIQRAANLQIRIEAQFAPETPGHGRGRHPYHRRQVDEVHQRTDTILFGRPDGLAIPGMSVEPAGRPRQAA